MELIALTVLVVASLWYIARRLDKIDGDVDELFRHSSLIRMKKKDCSSTANDDLSHKKELPLPPPTLYTGKWSCDLKPRKRRAAKGRKRTVRKNNGGK